MTPLGLRIARRHSRRGALLRPRPPLVLRRLRAPEAAGRARGGSHTFVSQRIELHAHLSWPAWLVPQARAGQASAIPGRPSMTGRAASSNWGPAAHPGPAAEAPGRDRAQPIGARRSPGPRSSRGGALALRRIGTASFAHAVSRLAPETMPAASALVAAAARRVRPGPARPHRSRSPLAEAPEAAAPPRTFVAVERVARAARPSQGEPPVPDFGRVALFPQPVPRQHAMGAPARPALAAAATEVLKPAPPPPTQPRLDVARLADDVYRLIQRKARIERERRGL